MTVSRPISSYTLPAYEGYALGAVVHEDRIILPALQHDCALRQRELEKLREKKELLFPKTVIALGGKQHELDSMLTLIDRAQDAYDEACEEWTKYAKEGYAKKRQRFAPEEAVPLEFSIKTKHNAFCGERMFHSIFHQRNASSQGEAESTLRRFVTELCSQDGTPDSLISPELVQSLSSRIYEMVQAEQHVALMGSFISLSRVKTIEPIMIKRGSISERMMGDPHRYYVISEAILGGTFLGFGKFIGVTQERGRAGPSGAPVPEARSTSPRDLLQESSDFLHRIAPIVQGRGRAGPSGAAVPEARPTAGPAEAAVPESRYHSPWFSDVFQGRGRAGPAGAPVPEARSTEARSTEARSTADIMANIGSFSFVSQGAIPKLAAKFEEANLWDVYCNWKQILMTDEHSGYPIALKVRSLAQIFFENGLSVPSPPPPLPLGGSSPPEGSGGAGGPSAATTSESRFPVG